MNILESENEGEQAKGKSFFFLCTLYVLLQEDVAQI